MVDPADDRALRAWFGAFDASHRHRWPGEPGWSFTEIQAQAVDRPGLIRTVLLAAVEDGSVVGVSCVELPEADNRHLVEVTVEVPPDHRRRGIGTALLVAHENLALEEGRTVLVGRQGQAVGVDPTPGRALAERHGYQVVLEDVRRDLAVPVPEEQLAALEGTAYQHATDYEVVTFADRWPDAYVEDRALFGQRMSTDVPLGEVDRTEERWDADRVRRTEALIRSMGRFLLVAAAVERASGRVVAFSEIAVPRDEPEKAYQWDTLVLREHRGHRLGLLMKVANLRQLATASPATSSVTTWNARQNDPMIAVNEALGCTVAGHQVEWQKRFA